MRPAAGWELQNMLLPMIDRQMSVEIVGSGSKRAIGRPFQAAAQLTTAAMQGIWLYEPTELVMSAQAGTPLAQVEATLASNGQMLSFEPIDLGPTTGGPRGTQTIGSIFASNSSGSRRITAGAARDNLLGIEAVNGRAELFHAGGRVMKNVTGVDLCRGLAGSWGTLAVLTAVTFKVLPWPEAAATLVYFGLPDDIGTEVMCAAMRLPYEVSGAVHLSQALARRLEHEGLRRQGRSITALRIENFRSSIGYRSEALKDALKVYGDPAVLDTTDSLSFWGELRHLSVMPYNRDTCLWRISTAPTAGPKVVAAIKRHMPAEAYYDWSGGLIWVEVPASADAGASDIRRAVAVNGGHATLIRAEPEVRASVEVFQPQAPAVEKLMRGLKDAFDPYRVLNPGRMYASF
ncbi:FAD-linked oxidase [Candidatus Filomicrobium marinum]|uniref:FAD-linked oxidase n=3 Tax=Hyphomicrobiaceae TaxID=45401 RepID=A0A0D6JAY8_9HYPH|nr:FAD-linked oxidase [Candidatus Filomicrobium marinum]CPR15034.1 FAD-linked oxidase [Candidatus Filomicrobium marinum]SDO71604.1 glycolate oxidase FAD binding subunit [Filomicrobium insigne]